MTGRRAIYLPRAGRKRENPFVFFLPLSIFSEDLFRCLIACLLGEGKRAGLDSFCIALLPVQLHNSIALALGTA